METVAETSVAAIASSVTVGASEARSSGDHVVDTELAARRQRVDVLSSNSRDDGGEGNEAEFHFRCVVKG